MTINKKQTYHYLKTSYKKNSKIKDTTLDKSLSGKRVKVFYNPKTKKSVVVHRGTASAIDWLKTNIPMIFGYEGGNRFKHAKKIQKAAEQKYGKENITTMGHSLGGRIAEKVGKNTSQIITYNKAATPKSIKNKTPINQIDIRTSRDPVSYLSTYQQHSNKPVIVKSKSYNLLNEHSIRALK